jgi:hypothetical protein
MSATGFIEVSKISLSHKPRKANGTGVINPHDAKEVKDEHATVKSEFIDKGKIKSFRPWGKSQDQEVIDGDFTIIYFNEDPLHVSVKSKDIDRDPTKEQRQRTTPTMLINENYRAFGRRVGATMLLDDEQEVKTITD